MAVFLQGLQDSAHGFTCVVNVCIVCLVFLLCLLTELCADYCIFKIILRFLLD